MIKVNLVDSDWLIQLRKKMKKDKVEVEKYRKYVRSPNEAPRGAVLYRGKKGGLYYLTGESKGERKMESKERKIYSEKYGFNKRKQKNLFGRIKMKIENLKPLYSKYNNEFFDIVNGLGAVSYASRIKHPVSAGAKIMKYRKEYKEDADVDDLTDWIGSRVEFDNEEDLNDAVEMFRKKYKVVELNDYRNGYPNANYYRRVHLIVDVGNGVNWEVQFGLKGMNFVYDLSHYVLYKDGDLDSDVKKNIENKISNFIDNIVMKMKFNNEYLKRFYNELSGYVSKENREELDNMVREYLNFKKGIRKYFIIKKGCSKGNSNCIKRKFDEVI